MDLTSTALAATEEFGQRCNQVQGRPAVLIDAEWRNHVETECAAYKELGRRFATITPVPLGVSKVDGLHKRLGGEMGAFADDMEQSVKHMDRYALLSAAGHMNALISLLGESTKEVEAVGHKGGL